MFLSADGDTHFLPLLLGSMKKIHYSLPRSQTLNIHRSNKRKGFHIEKANDIQQKL